MIKIGDIAANDDVFVFYAGNWYVATVQDVKPVFGGLEITVRTVTHGVITVGPANVMTRREMFDRQKRKKVAL
jgi:hypothetical protein